MEKKELFIFLGIIFLVVIIIFLINCVMLNGNHEQTEIKCIAENSILFVSKTCGHCAGQKEILGDNINLFEIIDCTTEYEKCAENKITAVPTWIVNGEKYTGKKSLTQLKELTGC